MQISTSFLFDRATTQMSTAYGDLAKSQAQIASGKQIINASDAPDQAAVIARLKSVIGRQDSYTKTLDSIESKLQAEGTTLKNASDVLIRIKEITVQANNATISDTGRKALTTEMQGLREQLLSLANSKDTNGNYMFGGSRVQTKPFQLVDGVMTYMGDQTRMSVAVGEQRSLPFNRPGTDAFAKTTGAGGGGFFETLDNLIKGINDKNAAVMSAGLTHIDEMNKNLSLAQAEGGTNLNVIDQQRTVIEDTKLTLKSTLSNSEDLDYATAVTEMNKKMLALEAAQASFAKISQLNLFNYIK